MTKLLIVLAIAIIVISFAVPPLVSAANTVEVLAGFLLLAVTIGAVGYFYHKVLLESKK